VNNVGFVYSVLGYLTVHHGCIPRACSLQGQNTTLVSLITGAVTSVREAQRPRLHVNRVINTTRLFPPSRYNVRRSQDFVVDTLILQCKCAPLPSVDRNSAFDIGARASPSHPMASLNTRPVWTTLGVDGVAVLVLDTLWKAPYVTCGNLTDVTWLGLALNDRLTFSDK
jgi:hypothetical protein